jgi:hypothetical protein
MKDTHESLPARATQSGVLSHKRLPIIKLSSGAKVWSVPPALGIVRPSRARSAAE